VQQWPFARSVAIVSDIHELVRESVLEAVSQVDLILHAGDVYDLTVLTQLWCTAARLRLRHSQHWHLLQDLPVQSIPMILRLDLGRWCAGVADMLVASGESSTERLFKACAPYARQIKRSSEIIGVLCRALGGHPGQRFMTTCAPA
jgi:hypothetical protein